MSVAQTYGRACIRLRTLIEMHDVTEADIADGRVATEIWLQDDGYLVRVVRVADGQIIARELVEHREAKP